MVHMKCAVADASPVLIITANTRWPKLFRTLVVRTIAMRPFTSPGRPGSVLRVVSLSRRFAERLATLVN